MLRFGYFYRFLELHWVQWREKGLIPSALDWSCCIWVWCTVESTSVTPQGSEVYVFIGQTFFCWVLTVLLLAMTLQQLWHFSFLWWGSSQELWAVWLHRYRANLLLLKTDSTCTISMLKQMWTSLAVFLLFQLCCHGGLSFSRSEILSTTVKISLHQAVRAD